MIMLALRIQPTQDLRQELKRAALQHTIQAGFILSGIGSLSRAAIRFAGQEQPQSLEGPFEVLSLQGTVAMAGIHVHMAIADSQGRVLGGHLCDGSIIYTTAEVVIGTAEDLVFTRELDEQTGFLELRVSRGDTRLG